MLTLKKVKELVGAPSHAKRTPSPKMLYEEGIVLLRREFDQGSHLTVYNSGYVLFSAGKRNTVFHIHDCCGDYPQPFDWDALLGLLHKKPPRRSSYEAQLSDSDSLVTTTQIAKEYGCGAKVFNRLLHLYGIQYRANGQWVLYSEHHGKGYTSSLTFRLQRSDGSEVEKLHTAWTQKGRKFLYHTLKRRGVLPLAEQGG